MPDPDGRLSFGQIWTYQDSTPFIILSPIDRSGRWNVLWLLSVPIVGHMAGLHSAASLRLKEYERLA